MPTPPEAEAGTEAMAGAAAPDQAAPDQAAPGTAQQSSFRQIFKATSIIGGAQILSIAIGIARTKVFALLLGPAGVGLLGLLNALMAAGSTVAQMGMSAVGTRQIAEAHASGDTARLALSRRAMAIAALVLSVAGGAGVWLLREPLARYALGDAGLAGPVGWVALGVALSVATVAQAAVIQGMRRMWDLAAMQIGGALLVAIVGLPLVWRFGEAAVPVYVILLPLANFIIGHVCVARLGQTEAVRPAFAELSETWRMFIVLGLPMMAAAVAGSLSALWIQAEIQAQLGLGALGLYVASNTIAMQYAGLVLTAMAGDYFPRLSGMIKDREAACALVNQQTEAALLLAGPIVLGMFALAPLVMALLYSEEFVPAGEVLRWQTAGTLLKVVSWPMGFILLAEGAGRVFFLTELVTMLVMALATAVLVGQFGIAGAGMGYLVAYALYLPLMFVFSAPRIGLVWSMAVVRLLALVAGGMMVLLWPVLSPTPVAIAAGALCVLGLCAWLGLRAGQRLGLIGRWGRADGASA